MVNTDPGDLTVQQLPVTIDPTVDTPLTGFTGSHVAFGVCSPSEDDLRTTAQDANTGQICTLLPTDQD